MYDNDYDCQSSRSSGGSTIGSILGTLFFIAILYALVVVAWELLKAAYLITEAVLLWIASKLTKRNVTKAELYGYYMTALMVICWLGVSTSLAYITAKAIVKGLGL